MAFLVASDPRPGETRRYERHSSPLKTQAEYLLSLEVPRNALKALGRVERLGNPCSIRLSYGAPKHSSRLRYACRPTGCRVPSYVPFANRYFRRRAMYVMSGRRPNSRRNSLTVHSVNLGDDSASLTQPVASARPSSPRLFQSAADRCRIRRTVALVVH